MLGAYPSRACPGQLANRKGQCAYPGSWQRNRLDTDLCLGIGAVETRYLPGPSLVQHDMHGCAQTGYGSSQHNGLA